MACPQCQAENPPAARFCHACGGPLEPGCPRCGHGNAPGSRFCTACGERLPAAGAGPGPAFAPYTPRHLAQRVLTSRTAIEGERKHVTVLFVDIVESSRLADRLDPEALHELMDRVLRLMTEAVHRYEGTVNQYLGDGLMALFGAPVALEDHALRAVEAALAIRETIRGLSEQLRREQGLEVRLRIGLNSGMVVVGKIGDDLRMDYTAIGDTTNLAARIQALAEPDSVLVSEATDRLVAAYVRREPLGPVEIKGRSEPVRLFRVTGRRRRQSRLEAHADAGLTALVGRERELAILHDRLDDARAGRGGVVGVVGEAGVGKSRLLYEFRRARAGERLTWLEGHCVPYGQGSAYLAVLEILRQNFDVEEGDNPLQVAEKLRRGLQALDPGLAWTFPLLGELLGAAGEAPAPLDPKDRQRRTFEAIEALTLAGARRRPVVLVLEDLQWIDRASEEAFAFFVDRMAATRTFLVTTHRPGHAVRWADRPHYTPIALDVLSREEMEVLVGRWLGARAVPADLVRFVWEKAEGNPFFAEEILAALRDRGLLRSGNGGGPAWRGGGVEVPGTVQDLISARLDRLAEPVKRTVQTAAAIGRAFGLSLLSRVAEEGEALPQHLEALKRLDVVREVRLVPEPEYAFKHGLIQDVAYGSLLTPRRRELHGAIARALEELHAGRLEEQAPALAYHYGRSAWLDRGLEYALRAGDRAARLYANAEAATYYEQALGLVRGLPPSPATGQAEIDAILRLAAVSPSRQDALERDRANLETARARAEGLGDEVRRSRVLYWLGRIAYIRWEPAVALARARESLEIAERLGDEALAAPPTNLLGRIHWQASDYRQAVHYLTRSVEQMRRLGDRAEEATAAGFAGFALAYLGDFARATGYVEHGLRLAQEIQNPFAEAALYLDRGIVRGEPGDWPGALADFENARRVAERVGDLFRIYVVQIFEGRARTMAGDPARARALLEESLVRAEQIGSRFARAWQKSFLAQARLALGEAGPAIVLCREAIAAAAEAGDRFPEAFAHRMLAEARLALAPAAGPEAAADLQAAIDIYEQIGTRPELARTYASQARLLAAQGRWGPARRRFGEAIELFAAMDMVRDREETAAALRRLEAEAPGAEEEGRA